MLGLAENKIKHIQAIFSLDIGLAPLLVGVYLNFFLFLFFFWCNKYVLLKGDGTYITNHFQCKDAQQTYNILRNISF